MIEEDDMIAPVEDLDEDQVVASQPGVRHDADVKCPRCKLNGCNWLADIPGGKADSDLVEVQFKNTRKGFYRNTTNLPLKIGDMVAVEAQPGHDIGRVSMTGALVAKQMARANLKAGTEIRRVFRLARPADLEKYEEACAKETDTMIRARRIADDLNLSMKIGDVEYQGDGNKAIFYYIADERVDFRQLIKVLAETFKVRIEMRQIGARQEAGRIGGIGPCGRPLCCSSWMTNFVSVATSAARYQDISLNPQKLAGQCAKLKCCLNFEVDTYVESIKRMPPREARLETISGTYYHFKTDIFKREITYSTDKSMAVNLVTISAARAFEVLAMNKEGEKPDSLLPDGDESQKGRRAVHDIIADGDLTRFDKKKKKKRKDKPRGDSEKPRDGGEKPRDGGEKPRDGEKQRGEAARPESPQGDAPRQEAGDNAETKPRERQKRGQQRQRRRGGQPRQGDKDTNAGPQADRPEPPQNKTDNG